MISFVIPLIAKKRSSDWENTKWLFERTLRSVCSQLDECFNVIVVCHDIPQVKFFHKNIIYEKVDYDFEETIIETGRYDYPENVMISLRDKGRKCTRGTSLAIEYGCDHVMVVDADDLVSNKLSLYCNRDKHNPGWYIDTGYTYNEKSTYLYLKRKKFHQECATSHVIRKDLIEIANNINYTSLSFADFSFWVDHGWIVGRTMIKNQNLSALPFRGAIYMRHELNMSNFNFGCPALKKLLKYLLLRRTITPRLSEEFGLYPL